MQQQRLNGGGVLGLQILLLIVGMLMGTYATWTNTDDYGSDTGGSRRLFMYTGSPRRYYQSRQQSYNNPQAYNNDYSYGGQNNGWENPASVEEISGDLYNDLLDKRAGANTYSFGLGKRSKAYGFGLGKRLESAVWKNTVSSALSPAYRQERRSKIYSFGLGKRNGYNSPMMELYEQQQSDYDDGSLVDKKSQKFAFGLGKRDVEGVPIDAMNPTPEHRVDSLPNNKNNP